MKKQSYVVFLRIGWMKNYQGLSIKDKIQKGGSHIDKYGFGHEMYNFLPFNNRYYGYFRSTSEGAKIDIKRISGKEIDKLENVLVVWLATSPWGGTYVVGWYKKATLYSELREAPPKSKRVYNGTKIGYYVETIQDDATLLSLDERTFKMPKGKEAPGQALIWYADSKRGKKTKEEVISYIKSWDSGKKKSKKKRKNISVEKKKQIEITAIDVATNYFTNIGFTVNSVESENVGWDLEASRQKSDNKLKIEVKGTSLSQINVGLTPNEYKAMQRNLRDYRLCIVKDALKNPSLSIFSYSKESKDWRSEENEILNFEEKTSAIVQIAKN